MVRLLQCAAIALVIAVYLPASGAFSTTRKNERCIVRKGDENGALPIDAIDVEDSSNSDRYPAPPSLCRFARTTEGLVVGEYDPTAERCLPVGIDGAAKEAFARACDADETTCAFERVAASADCKVWWREVNQDVIPPIPELVISLGVTSRGEKLALCRDFQGRLGALYLEGKDYGRCIYEQEDGTTAFLDGGRFHVLQGVQRHETSACVESEAMAKVLRRKMLALLEAHIEPSDERDIADITGKPFEELRATLASAGSCFLEQVMSSARFVPTPANVLGLRFDVFSRSERTTSHSRPRLTSIQTTRSGDATARSSKTLTVGRWPPRALAHGFEVDAAAVPHPPYA